MTYGQMQLLPKIIGVVVLATIVQGITSFALTQMLSKEGQRLISELRMQVQEHIGRLPVSFYDENRTGTLVARIMTDVEGVRNLIGTGLMDFVGGVLTATIVFVFLIHLSVSMTLLTFVILLLFGLILQNAFKTIRPIFRERAKINAEVTGRLTESLGGVRVVKGYHAEASEARVFAGGVKRLLDNVISSLTAQSLMSLASTAGAGCGGRTDHVHGRARDRCRTSEYGRICGVHDATGVHDCTDRAISEYWDAVDGSAGGAGPDDGDSERTGRGFGAEADEFCRTHPWRCGV